MGFPVATNNPLKDPRPPRLAYPPPPSGTNNELGASKFPLLIYYPDGAPLITSSVMAGSLVSQQAEEASIPPPLPPPKDSDQK